MESYLDNIVDGVFASNSGQSSVTASQPMTMSNLRSNNLIPQDEQVERIAAALRTTESGSASGNYTVRARDEGYGAYQFMPNTWKRLSAEYANELGIGSGPLPMTREHQDSVAKWEISRLVKKGYNPHQIASIWNSGKPEWQGKVGVNRWGVEYNVPRHVAKFTKAYNALGGDLEYPADVPVLKGSAQYQTKLQQVGAAIVPSVSGTIAPPSLMNNITNLFGPNEAQAADIPPIAPAGESDSYLDKILKDYKIIPTEQAPPPQTQPAAIDLEPAPFGTMTKAALADDPATRFSVYAARRFPNEPIANAIKRYFIKDGVVYFADVNPATGKQEFYKELGGDKRPWPNPIPEDRNIAQGIADSPKTIGAIGGAMIGGAAGVPNLGAGLGTAIGGLAKKAAAHTYLDEPRTLPEMAGGALVDFGFGYGGNVAGTKLANMMDYRIYGAGPIKRKILADADLANYPSVASSLRDLYAQKGITPTLPELTNSPTLKQGMVIAGRSGGPGAERFDRFIEGTRVPETDLMLHRELTAISPETSVFEGGKGLSNALAKRYHQLWTEAKAAAKPHYREAYANAGPVDITDIVQAIDAELAPDILPRNSASRTALQRVKDMLTRVEPGKPADGITSQEARGMMDDSYHVMDSIRKIGIDPEQIRKDFGDSAGEGVIKMLQNKLPGIIRKKGNGGQPLDELADAYGFASAEELYYSIKDYTPKYVAEQQFMAGNTAAVSAKEVPQERLATIDLAKKEIAKMVQGLEGQGIPGDTRRRLVDIQQQLADAMKEASPDYAAALAAYAEKMKPANAFQYGVEGPPTDPLFPAKETTKWNLAKAGEQDWDKLPGRMMKMSPDRITELRSTVTEYDPETWNASVSSWLQEELAGIRDATRFSGNFGRAYQERIFGSEAKKARLQAALSAEQFQSLSDAMEVLSATGRIVYQNSMTTPLKLTADEMMKEAGGTLGRGAGFATAALYPGRWHSILKDSEQIMQRLRFPEYNDKFIQAMLDPQNAALIGNLRSMPNTLRKAVTVLGIISSLQVEKELPGVGPPNNYDPYGLGKGQSGQQKPIQ